jgi:cell wall-associated NlpC family hydrolase
VTRHVTSRHGRRRSAASVVALAVVLAGILGTGAPASAQTDLQKAQAAANALRDKVDLLESQSEAAAEDYGAINDQLGDLVTALIVAEQNVDSSHQGVNEAVGRTDDAARQMYMSGGPGAIYASVLEGRDISDVLDRMASVDSVVRGDIVATGDARVVAAKATATRASLALLTSRRRVLEDQAAAAATRAADLHAQASAALAAADATVRRLVDEERALAQARAEAAAAAALTGTVPWGSNPVPPDALAAVDRAIAEATADPGTPYAAAAIADARHWLGTPYSAGGGGKNGPTTGWCSSLAPDDGRLNDGTCAATSTIGFDCSSLMVRIFSAAGRDLPRTSRQQWKIGVHVPLSDLKPGDLLFWANNLSNPGSIHHVALYIGHGLMVHSPHTGDHVKVASVYLNGLIGAVRPL